MSVYNNQGVVISPYDINGFLSSAYDIYGSLLTDDYNIASTDYERSILSARNEWMTEARKDKNIIPLIIHADQHGRFSANNTLIPYLSKAISWNEISACIGLGDTCDYSLDKFQAMEKCLSILPKNKQINIWGNHDTWYNTQNDIVLHEEQLQVLNTYFDNSSYNGNHKFNDYGIEYMIDEEKKVKYVVIGGWEYDSNLGGHSHYNIGKDSMDYIIQMLSTVDDYDIVILSHIQPFSNQITSSWSYPPAEGGTQGAGGGIDVAVGTVVNKSETTLDEMLIDRQNKGSGTIKDSFGNIHSYDFTKCTSNILCCFAGHEHCDKYMWQNNNIPVYIFDAYAYDKHPFYFVNIDRIKEQLNIWKVDDTPTIYNFQIPFNKSI